MEKEALLLNIESATGTCSVVISEGDRVIAFAEAEQTFQHAKVITTLIGDVVKSTGCQLRDLDAVAVSSGPGSYTSLRVGISTAKGICYALDKPLISVDTLQALALSGMEAVNMSDVIYCPMIDARRMEVYFSLFDKSNNQITGPKAMVVTADAFDEYFQAERNLVFCGSGAEKCRDILSSKYAHFYPSECSARYFPTISHQLFQHKKFESVAYYKPLYLKPPNITTPKHINLLKT